MPFSFPIILELQKGVAEGGYKEVVGSDGAVTVITFLTSAHVKLEGNREKRLLTRCEAYISSFLLHQLGCVDVATLAAST